MRCISNARDQSPSVLSSYLEDPPIALPRGESQGGSYYFLSNEPETQSLGKLELAKLRNPRRNLSLEKTCGQQNAESS